MLSARAIEMVALLKAFCGRHNVPFDLSNYRLTERPGDADAPPTIRTRAWLYVVRIFSDGH